MGSIISIILPTIVAIVFYRGLRYGVDYRSKENMIFIALGFFVSFSDPNSDFVDIIKRTYYALVLLYIVLFAAFTGRKRKNDNIQ